MAGTPRISVTGSMLQNPRFTDKNVRLIGNVVKVCWACITFLVYCPISYSKIFLFTTFRHTPQILNAFQHMWLLLVMLYCGQCYINYICSISSGIILHLNSSFRIHRIKLKLTLERMSTSECNFNLPCVNHLKVLSMFLVEW